MSDSNETCTRQPGPAMARLSVNFNPDWVVQDISDAGRGFVYQTIPGISSSLVFVRWGSHETLENYVRPLGGSGWTATVEEDEFVNYLSVRSRRLRIVLESNTASELPELSGSSADSSYQRLIIVVTSLKMCGLPTLLGYRLPEVALHEWGPRLEQILATACCEN